jgi:hypothetical protein
MHVTRISSIIIHIHSLSGILTTCLHHNTLWICYPLRQFCAECRPTKFCSNYLTFSMIQTRFLALKHKFTFLWGGTKSTWYCGHFWPIVPAPDDRWGWLWSNWWYEDWQGKPKYSEKTCPSATLSTTNPTRPDPGSNPGRRSGKPATNRLSYGAALKFTLLITVMVLDNVNGIHASPISSVICWFHWWRL